MPKHRARAMRFRPSLEQLEPRAVPATTVSLAAGVLTVTGTSANDTITLKESGGKVAIAGISKTFATSKISSVVVRAGKGNDNVSLVGLKASWSKPITVSSAAGTDKIKVLDGSTVTLRGTNQRLTIPSDDDSTNGGGGNNGGGGSNGGGTNTGDWFDQYIHDAALRQLLRTEYSDSAIDRSEMISVFDTVQADGVVTATEFGDLSMAANNAWLFNSAYVTDITKNVVLGNTANAKFQGATLGNLSAGAAANKLDKLVDKWFLGLDRPNAAYSGVTVTYVNANGSLFASGGPKYTDVKQGAVGDCYFVGTLAEIAQESPATIQNMFVVNGDGTYGVRFFQNGNARYVTVDSALPTYSGGYFLYANMGGHASNSSNVLWVALAEKAYVQMNESGWLRPAGWGGGINAYSGVEGGMFSDVTRQVANRAASNMNVMGLSDAATLNNAVTSGKFVGFASTGNPADGRIVGNHQYVVVAYNNSSKVVTLFNPWGINNGSAPGLVDISLSQLGNSFDYWSVA